MKVKWSAIPSRKSVYNSFDWYQKKKTICQQINQNIVNKNIF